MEMAKLLANWGFTTHGCGEEFDQALEQSVRKFQRRMFLREDGVVGPLTWQTLYKGCPVHMPPLRLGSRGRSVAQLQQALSTTGDYRAAIDGQFGDLTDAAVRRFQRRNGLVIDGVVGTCSWRTLGKTSRS